MTRSEAAAVVEKWLVKMQPEVISAKRLIQFLGLRKDNPELKQHITRIRFACDECLKAMSEATDTESE